MDANAVLVGLIVVDNRIVESLKRGLVSRLGESRDELAGLIVLLLSFVVGFGEVALLPSLAMFGALGATPFADAVLTGIVIGAGANGLDILGKGFNSLINKPSVKVNVNTEPSAASENAISEAVADSLKG